MLRLYVLALLPMIKNVVSEEGIVINAFDVTLKFKDGSAKHLTKDLLIRELKQIIGEKFLSVYVV